MKEQGQISPNHQQAIKGPPVYDCQSLAKNNPLLRSLLGVNLADAREEDSFSPAAAASASVVVRADVDTMLTIEKSYRESS